MLLTGENNSFNPIMPQNPVGLSRRRLKCAVELVARIGQMTMDNSLGFSLYASTTSARE